MNSDKTKQRVRRSSTLIALEPRMLFDGAVAPAADAVIPDTHVEAVVKPIDLLPAPAVAPGKGGEEAVDETAPRTQKPIDDQPERVTKPIVEVDSTAKPADPSQVARQLMVVDPSVTNWESLVAGVDADVDVIVLDPARDGIAQIAAALDGTTRYSAVHLVSHGAQGQMQLGSTTVDAGALGGYSADLARLGDALTDDGDLLLYGCDIADGEAGRTFIDSLAAATGADVAASTDDSGAAALGGDWELESSTGRIESDLAIGEAVLAAYDGLLKTPGATDAMPDVAFARDGAGNGTAAQRDVLLGETFTFTANFDNRAPAVSTRTGFAPYVDLFVPATGVDGTGAAVDDGVTITGATYLGQPLTITEITLTGGSGSAITGHPYYTDAGDATGRTVPTVPAGMKAGDKLYVIELPFGSFTPGQPAIDIDITGVLSDQADLAQPLAIGARAGFRFGNDALDNATSDPSIVQGSVNTLTVNPELYRVTTHYIGPEDETATGPNYQRAYRIDVDIAAGQTITDLDLSSILAAGTGTGAGRGAVQFEAITGTPASIDGTPIGAAPSGGWTNVNGVLVSNAGAAATFTGGASDPTGLGGTVTRTASSVTGTAGSTDVSMVVGFHVPEFNATGGGSTPVLDPASGDDVFIDAHTATSGQWLPVDTRDRTGTGPGGAVSIAYDSRTDSDPAPAHRLEAQSIAIQTGVTNLSGTEIRPGHTLEYTLDAQVSDFFAFGGGPTQSMIITETISDGQDFDTTFTPVITILRGTGGSVSNIALLPGEYTITPSANGTPANGAGSITVTYDLQMILDRLAVNGQIPNTAASRALVGDQFDADNLQDEGQTTLQIRYHTTVRESYRVTGAATHPQLNEGDSITDGSLIAGTVLDAALDPAAPGLQGENDDSGAALQIARNAIALEVTSINGQAAGATPIVAPTDDVTYRMRYLVPTGDYEDFSLSAYLPLPIFHTGDIDDNGTPDAGFNYTAGGSATPAVGQFTVRASNIGYGGNEVVLPGATTAPTDGQANAVSVTFSNRTDPANQPLYLEVYFTIRATDEPFADRLYLTAQSQSAGNNTTGVQGTTQAIDQLQITAPVVSIWKTAIQDDVPAAPTPTFARTFELDDTSTAGNPNAVFTAAAGSGTAPFTTVTSSNRPSVDTDLLGADRGDAVRFAVVVENTGSSSRGAFDVVFRDTIPFAAEGVTINDVGNIQIRRGDGTVVAFADLRTAAGAAISDATGLRAALFDPAGGVQLVDDTGGAGVSDDQGGLGAGRDAGGTAITDGSNIIVVTYDVNIPAGVEVGREYTSSATLVSYTGSEGGGDYADLDGNVLTTSDNPTEEASVNVAELGATKVIVGTDQAFTAGNNVVIGELVQYRVTINVPEGGAGSLRLVDTLDAGMSFVSVDSITDLSGGNLTFSAGLPATSAAVITSSGGAANRMTLDFGNVTNIAGNTNATAESVEVVYTVVVRDITGNQSAPATLLNNSAVTTSTDSSRTVSAPNVTVVEPQLTVSITPSTASADIGDLVTFTLQVANGGGGLRAHDVDLADIVLPAGLTYVPGSLTQTAGVVPDTIESAGAEINGTGILANYASLDPGQSSTFTFQAQVTSATLGGAYNVPANLVWSSLPGTANNDLSPLTAAGDAERTGADGVGGALNDYAAAASASVAVTPVAPVLTIVTTSEAGTTADGGNPAQPQLAETIDGAIGEIVRYRMVVRVPEVNAAGAEIVVALPAGIRFLDDNSAAIAFVADGDALDSSTLDSLAGIDQPEPGAGTPATAADVASVLPTALLPGSAIQAVGGGAFVAGTDVRFVLGDLVNTNTDADGEFIVIEFNGVVDDVTGNQSIDNSTGALAAPATSLPVNYVFRSGGSDRGTSDTDTVDVVEPAIVDLAKRVIDVDPGSGLVTFEVTFSNDGDSVARDVRLTDDFTGLAGLTFNGAAGVSGLPGGAVNNTTANGVDIAIGDLAPAASVTIRYTATLAGPIAAIPARDAEVTYTSLTTAGTTLTVMDGATPLAVSTTPAGAERDSSNGPGADAAALDNYVDRDPAGLGMITGTLWDDSEVAPDNVIEVGENRLAAVNVQLTWAGIDNTFGTADDRIYTTTTGSGASAGQYVFTGLAEGSYRIDSPTSVNDATSGPVVIRYDAGGGAGPAQVDGRISLTLPDAGTRTNQDFGYVRTNDTPTASAPGAASVDEDNPLRFNGGSAAGEAGLITVGDVDAGASATNVATVSLPPLGGPVTVTGTLAATASGAATVTGNGTTRVQITGTIADINTTLASLRFDPSANGFGSTTLSVRIDDRGNGGDADGDLVPFEAGTLAATGVTGGDNLSATVAVPITVNPVNDSLTANPDLREIPEPNPLAITPVSGNAVTAPNTTAPQAEQADVDIESDPITVQGVTAGSAAGVITGGVTSTITGQYGSLVMQADGSYSYTPGPAAQQVRAGQTVDDVFTYSINDRADFSGNTATTTLTIRIVGANDAPVAMPDANSTTATSVTPASGNVIAAGAPTDQVDSDIDSQPSPSDTLTVIGVDPGDTGSPAAGDVGTPLAGTYGTVTIQPDGSYAYQVDRNDPAVIALAAGGSIDDVFTYTVSDGQGGTATTTLTITITGANEPPDGIDRVFRINEDQGRDDLNNALQFVPSGGNASTVFGFTDPDVGDALTAIRIDTVPASGQLLLDGQPVTSGQTIPVARLGGLRYVPAQDANSSNLPAAPRFTYSVRDSFGVFDPVPNSFTILIDPVNDPPTAPEETRTIDGTARLGTPDARITGVPPPTDPDVPADTLTIRVDSVPELSGGRFFRPDGTPVQVGERLTITDLQNLSFVPQPNPPGQPRPDGLVPVGSMRFTVDDGHGGTAPGAIHINVRPSGGGQGPNGFAPAPTLVPPVVDATPVPRDPPGATRNTLPGQPLFTSGSENRTDFAPGTIVLPAVAESRAQRVHHDARVAGSGVRDDFDPFTGLPSAIAPIDTRQPSAADATLVMKPAAPTTTAGRTDECGPDGKPLPKPKPKAVKRSIFAEPLGDKPKTFSEQVNAAGKRFKPPLKARPKPTGPQC